MADHPRYINTANLPRAFFDNAGEADQKPLFFAKRTVSGVAWDGIRRLRFVKRLAGALIGAGITPRDRVIVSAENRPEWAIADLAIMAIGAIVVPAYTTNTEDDHHFIMEHSGAAAIITSGGLLASRLALAATRAPQVRTMIVMDPNNGVSVPATIAVRHWSEIMAKTPPLANLDEHIDAIDSDDTCCLVYTSGTGGRPKGVMLTHRSIQACITASIEILQKAMSPTISVSCRCCHCRMPMSIPPDYICQSKPSPRSGIAVGKQIGANLLEVSPTLMTAVPRLYEVLHDQIMHGIRSKVVLLQNCLQKHSALGANVLRAASVTA